MKRNQEAKQEGIFLCQGMTNSPPMMAQFSQSIIKAVMTLAAKVELGAIYLNAKEAVYIQQIPMEMGHQQPQTPIQTNNLTTEGVKKNKIQPKQTKVMDMRYYWFHDRKPQVQFRIHWRPGKTNRMDYFMKHHPPAHHVSIRSEFLTKISNLAEA